MIYLTFNDAPSGVFYSQVVDVCKHIRDEFAVEVTLVSIISTRDFRKNRRLIKQSFPDAIVIPAFPKLRNWQWNIVSLYIASLLIRDRYVIARGAFAAMLGLKLRKLGRVDKVVYDGRGAVAAEWHEYSVGDEKNLGCSISDIEKHSVLESDYRIAVSSKLIDYWRTSFGYEGEGHVVIPCTLNASFQQALPDSGTLNQQRERLGFTKDDIVLVYSGSVAGWQSFKILDDYLIGCMERNPALKVLFLAQVELEHLAAYKQFPGRVQQKWVRHDEVLTVLTACDYGLMIREQSVTNRVAAPTKFAEYLAAGLQVIISESLGDYSDFVASHDCGYVIAAQETEHPCPKIVTYEDKVRSRELALTHFTKEAYKREYERLVRH